MDISLLASESIGTQSPAPDSRLAATVIVLVMLGIVVRTIATALMAMLAAVAKVLGMLFSATVLFAIVSLTLVAQLIGGVAVRQAQTTPSDPLTLVRAPDQVNTDDQ